MRKRKAVYSILALLLTTLSVSLMIFKGKMDYIASTQYSQQYAVYDNPEDEEYLGYIFNDYNKRVNVDYVDEIPAEAVDNPNIESSSSLSELGEEETARSIRSERIIEERAGEVASGTNSKTAGFYNSVEDKAALVGVMRKLSENELMDFKRLFDREVSQEDIKSILAMLKRRLSDAEYNWLVDTVDTGKSNL